MGHYVVTGCAGFIASRTCQLLIEQGHKISGCDNFNEAYDAKLKYRRNKTTLDTNTQSYYCVARDITDFSMAEFLEIATTIYGPIDGILNFAALAGVHPSVKDPKKYYETNVLGTLNLLEACRQFNINKFVLASTSSVYGKSTDSAALESNKTDRPLSPYAASKMAAESLCYTYHYLHNIDISIPRFFTVYGPAGRPDMSIFRFIRRIEQELPVTVYGDGSQERDFTFVDDIANGVIASLIPVSYKIFNLGSDNPVAISEIIAKIAVLLGKSPKIVYEPKHPSDPQRTCANHELATTLFQWKPQTHIDDGLVKAVEWYLKNKDFVLTLKDYDAI